MTQLIRNLFNKVLGSLEDQRYPSIGPHIKFMSFVGHWKPNTITRFLYFLTIAFFSSQYIKCLVYLNTESFKLLLAYAPFHLGIVKAYYFKKDYKKWEELISYVSTTECAQLSRNEDIIDKIIIKYTRHNRIVTYLFWAMSFLCNIGIFTEPYQKNEYVINGTSTYIYIFDGYTPFKREPPGYYASMAFQTFIGHISSAYVISWDSFVVALMIYFAGQLKIARLVFCTRLIEGDAERSHQNIAEFHRHYTNLVRYQELLKALISPVMFIYLVVISINLGVCIIQTIGLQDNIAALVTSAIFILAMLVQLLYFYYHSNEVTVESTLLSYGTFESNWTGSNKKLQKEIFLLGATTQKVLFFKAGPFNEMSLATFVGILRASYSFYTLLNETN